jgi:hypothetical protein
MMETWDIFLRHPQCVQSRRRQDLGQMSLGVVHTSIFKFTNASTFISLHKPNSPSTVHTIARYARTWMAGCYHNSDRKT